MRNNVKRVVEDARDLLNSILERHWDQDPWQKYVDAYDGWFKCMCDTGFRLIKEGLKMDWDDVTDPRKRPKWCRQLPFKACKCGVSFFAKIT